MTQKNTRSHLPGFHTLPDRVAQDQKMRDDRRAELLSQAEQDWQADAAVKAAAQANTQRLRELRLNSEAAEPNPVDPKRARSKRKSKLQH